MSEIMPAKNSDDIRKGVEVIKDAWGADDLSTIMKDFLTGIRSNGGLVLLAYEGNDVVGISFSFVGYKKNKIYLYSHMTGVKRAYKNSGLGFELKKSQREWAISNGFDLVSWTFDPLQGLNSKFNLRKLGVIARNYRRNHYGTMTDSINSGLRSDRVVAEWFIKSDDVIKRLNGSYNGYFNLEDAIITEMKDEYRIVKEIRKDIKSDTFRIEIPFDITYIRNKNIEDAISWRNYTAEIYEHYFSKGYALVDFYSIDSRNYQVISRKLPKKWIKENIFQE